MKKESQRTDAQMGVDGGITSRTSQVLVLTVRNVEVSLWITVFLGQTEIDNIDLVATLTDAHQEIVRLDITVDKGLGVDVLDAGDKLVGKEKNGLQGELAVAEVEQILQTWPKEIENHSIVVTLGSKPADKGDADTTSQRLVDTGLIFELGILGLDRQDSRSPLLGLVWGLIVILNQSSLRWVSSRYLEARYADSIVLSS